MYICSEYLSSPHFMFYTNIFTCVYTSSRCKVRVIDVIITGSYLCLYQCHTYLYTYFHRMLLAVHNYIRIICMYIYTCIYVYMYVYVYMCVYMYIYMYVCICVYIYIKRQRHTYSWCANWASRLSLSRSARCAARYCPRAFLFSSRFLACTVFCMKILSWMWVSSSAKCRPGSERGCRVFKICILTLSGVERMALCNFAWSCAALKFFSLCLMSCVCINHLGREITREGTRRRKTMRKMSGSACCRFGLIVIVFGLIVVIFGLFL